jgi:hypothetical protein
MGIPPPYHLNRHKDTIHNRCSLVVKYKVFSSNDALMQYFVYRIICSIAAFLREGESLDSLVDVSAAERCHMKSEGVYTYLSR